MPPWFTPDINVNLELVNKVDKMNFPSKTKVIAEDHINFLMDILKYLQMVLNKMIIELQVQFTYKNLI